jgi:hypothetical protein
VLLVCGIDVCVKYSYIGNLSGQFGYFHLIDIDALPRVAIVNSIITSQSEALEHGSDPSSWHHIFHLHVDIR